MRSGPPVDRAAFERLRRIIPNQLAARRPDDAAQLAMAVPDELAFKLTNRCDLRCTHCYQWGEDGHHRELAPAQRTGDLPLEVIAKALEATRERRSNLYFWGGEPLIYRQWDGLVSLLEADRRLTTICTNGTNLAARLDSLAPISDQLEVLISLDGLEPQHDAVRGLGSFARSLAGLRALTARRREGRWQGELSVNCVITDAMVGQLVELATFLEAEEVDTFFVSFPWYLAPEAVARMDRYVAEHLAGVVSRHATRAPSWHAYTYHLDPSRFAVLAVELQELAARTWRMKVRANPELSEAEREPFLRGSDLPAQGKTRCLSLRSRMDVMPSGEVVSCKFFPEFVVADLAVDEMASAWRSTKFDEVRKTVNTHGLMPGCAKCPLLYTRGA